MKRSALAWTVYVGLCACSGQRNEDLNTLGSAKRDAAADAQTEDGEDADVAEDADISDGEHAAASDEDASAPGDDAGAANDAGMSTADAGAVGDAGVAGDAGSNPNQLRIKLGFEAQFTAQASIFFSYADGGVQGTQTPDGTGLLVSDTAPAMFTVALPSRGSNLNQHYDMVTVVAPALGDFIEIAPPPERLSSTQTIRYLASVGSVPVGGYAVSAYAGVDGCSQGYQDLVPAPTSAMQIGQRVDCQLESHGSVIAVMYDEPGAVLRYAGALLPAIAAAPVSFTLDQWLVPEELTLRLANGAPSARPEAFLWLRKGALKVRVNDPDSPPPTALPFKVARGIVDAFDAVGWFERTPNVSEHLFGKNRPASAAEITLDLNEALPELDHSKVSKTSLPLLRPSASWGVAGGGTPADALVAMFTWSWQPNSDSTASLTWFFVAPGDTTSLSVPATPSTGTFGFGPIAPADSDVLFAGVEYYDSDQQAGYRDFLKERLRPGATRSDAGIRTGSLARDIPVGGNTRMARFLNP